MKVKNNFYNSLKDIIFIDLYPDDIKNNFEGVEKKLNNCIQDNIKSA